MIRSVSSLLRGSKRDLKLLSVSITDRSYFEGKFQEEGEEKILKVLNEVSQPQDLWKYTLTKRNVEKLLEQKNLIGRFKGLDDPLDTLTPRVLEKFYNSILKEFDPVRYGDSVIGSVLVPEVKENASKIMSILTTGNSVFWSVIRRKEQNPIQLEVEELSFIEIPIKPKQHYLSLLTVTKELVSNFPECDLYVFEEPTFIMNAQKVNFAVYRAQLQSFLIGFIAARCDTSRIVAIKSSALGRMFKLKIGNECVSGQNVAERLLTTSDNLRIRDEPFDQFMKAKPVQREMLSSAFLLNMAYWKGSHQFS